jgi:hypothetical protein
MYLFLQQTKIILDAYLLNTKSSKKSMKRIYNKIQHGKFKVGH